MKVFPNINELLKRLNNERKLLHELFEARKKFDFRYEDGLKFVNSEQNLRLLIDYGVVREEDGLLELEEAYMRFFEEILRLNENITSSNVEENLQQLKDNIDFYLKERDNSEARRRYVNRIIRVLRNIMTQASTKTIELKRVINDTYRQERNYEIKRQKLENNLAVLGSIASLIRNTEHLLCEREEILNLMTPDQRLANLSINARIRFKEVFHSLIDLEHTIRDYIHQIDIYDRKVKRIRKLKYLKDQLTWEKTTDVCEVVGRLSHQIIETLPYTTVRISLSLLRDTDAGLDALSAMRRMIARRQSRKPGAFAPLKADELDAGYLTEDFVDTDVIADAFAASSRDLYSFVKNYPFAMPKTMDQKMEYYTEIVINHHDRLLITGDWATDGLIDYPLIYNRP